MIICRSDRIRLINFDRRIAALVKGVILQFFQTKEPCNPYSNLITFKMSA